METITKDVKTKLDEANPDKDEGYVAEAIEEQTAKIPSDAWLWVALGSMAASLVLKVMKRDDISVFVGLWAPSLLLFGIYNKLVKQLGHDSKS
ncbi:MAG TPA: hypothetical protein VHO50_06465 [Bacteroidales bacterium]|nr:hypothetical protein [Bacteroidales bacterium]